MLDVVEALAGPRCGAVPALVAAGCVEVLEALRARCPAPVLPALEGLLEGALAGAPRGEARASEGESEPSGCSDPSGVLKALEPGATGPSEEGDGGARLEALYAQRRGEEERAGAESWHPGEPWLRRPPAGTTSEAGQAAFEIGYKLEFAQEPVVLLQALLDLGQRAVHDCPPEHFLLHRAPLEIALRLAQNGAEREVWSAALRAVHHFVQGLRAAAALVGDERFTCQDEKYEAGFPKSPAFFPEAPVATASQLCGKEQGFSGVESEVGDLLPVVPFAHKIALSVLSLLHHREKHAEVVPILQDLVPLIRDFGDVADTSERFRQYFCVVNDALASLQNPGGTSVFGWADMNVVEVASWLLEAAGRPENLNCLLPTNLAQLLTLCVTNQFVVHCRPDTAARLASGLEAVDPVAVELSAAARDASKVFSDSLETVHSFASKPVKGLAEIEKLAREMKSSLRNIHVAADTKAARDYVDAAILAMENASQKAFDDVSSLDIEASELLGPVAASLIASPSPTVRASVVRALAFAVCQSSGQRLRGAMLLMGAADIMSKLMKLCLTDGSSASTEIPTLLQKVFSERNAALCDAVCDCQAWLSSAAVDPSLGCEVAGVLALCRNWRARSDDPWKRVEDVLRQLYSVDGQRRREAAASLVAILFDVGISIPFDVTELPDPLQLVLESPSVRRQPSAKETSGFRARGVQSLKDVFTNLELERGIRKSAGDQLLYLVSDEKLRCAILTDDVAACCQHEAMRAITNEPLVDPYFVSICVQILSAATWRQSEHLASGSHLGDSVLPLAPLLFHPYAQLRQAMASLLLPFLFKDGRFAVDDSGLFIFHAPSVFTAAFAFPAETVALESGTFFAAEGSRERTLQSMLEQSRILQGGVEEAISLLAEPEKRPTSISADAASAALSTLRSLDVTSRVEILLACVETSKNHGDCIAALQELNDLSVCSGTVCQALCLSDWAKSFRKIMEVSPASAQDFCVWLPLLPLLQRMLLSGHMTRSGLLCLALRLKQAAVPIMKVENMPVMKAIPEVAAELGRAYVGSDGTVLSLDAVRLGVMEGSFEAVRALLQACRARAEADISEQVLELFFAGDFFHYVTESVIVSPTANYRCRCLALEVLHSAVLCTADVMALSRSSSEERQDIRLALSFPIPFLVDHICIPPPGEDDPSRAGRALLILSITFIRLVMETFLPEAWLPGWGRVPGTFWLSKLCRDPDRAVRECAYRIAALLVHPSSETMCDMVAKSWPDCARHMMHTAVNTSECFAVRSSSILFVGRAYAADVSMSPDFRGFKAMRFVEQYDFWKVLTELSSKVWVPSCILESCLEFLTQVVLSDADLLSERVFSAGHWGPMLRNVVHCFSHTALEGGEPSNALKKESQLFRMMGALARFVSALMASGSASQRESFAQDSAIVPALLDVLGPRLQRLMNEFADHDPCADPSKVCRVRCCGAAVLDVARAVNSVVCTADKMRHELCEGTLGALRGFCRNASGVLQADIFSMEAKLALSGLLASIYGTRKLLGAIQEVDTEVGADLCLALHPLYSTVAISYGRSVHPSSATSAAIAAFRNVLAHSSEAKMEALGLQLPLTAVEMCTEMHSLIVLQRLQSSKGEPAPESSRSVERQKLLWNLTVLKHAAYRSPELSEAIQAAGALEMVQKILAFALSDSLVLQEVCGLLCNLAAASERARFEITGVRLADSSYIIDSLLAMIRVDAETHSFCAVLLALRPLTASSESRCALLKTPVLQQCFSVLKNFSQKTTREARKCLAVLAFFTDLAAHTDTQMLFLKTNALPGLLDVVYDLIEIGNHAVKSDATFFLRNLAFLAENKPHFVANTRTLALLLGAVDGDFSNIRASAYAASAMWALLYNGQKVKATFKKTRNLVPRLTNAHNMLQTVARGSPTKGDYQDSGNSDALDAVRCLDAVLELLRSDTGPSRAADPPAVAAAQGVVH